MCDKKNCVGQSTSPSSFEERTNSLLKIKGFCGDCCAGLFTREGTCTFYSSEECEGEDIAYICKTENLKK